MNNNYLVGDKKTISSLVSNYGPVKAGYITKDFRFKYDNKYSSSAFDFSSLLFDVAGRDQFFRRYVSLYFPLCRGDLK